MDKPKNTLKPDEDMNEGTGMNFNHPSPEIVEKLTEKLQVLMGKIEAENFTELCKPYGGVSKVFRDYARVMLKKSKETTL